ncbi:MAG: HD-GYP domain-containing protein [Saccharofermentans sp.]|nr:HD-GYP domain-containing protein [Saccharofermentans sp.]
MFFTNGGVEGGTPIWLLLGTIYIALILEGKFKIAMFISEGAVLVATWVFGYYHPEYITQYSTWGNYFDTLVTLFVVSFVIGILVAFQIRLYRREEEHKNVERLFTQTATALVNAIDAKDKYTHGHSARVAEYSRKIAELAGKSPSECDEIYYVALLHDVGKIGIPEQIINKKGKLTDEEYAAIKQHATMGAEILKDINVYPYLSIGAHYHHERFDGKGYPDGLKGTDIPEIARIISVADAYDAMTSSRSYRDPIPQQQVREEIVECVGTQFDPRFANIMIHLIDEDTKYKMKQKDVINQPTIDDVLTVRKHRDDVATGIHVTPRTVTINIKVSPAVNGTIPNPSLILFDSLDGRYHSNANDVADLMYFEYCELGFDGQANNANARRIETNEVEFTGTGMRPGRYKIEACRFKDHALIRITGGDKTYGIEGKTIETIIALPDSARYSYIGFTGENCIISDMTIERSDELITEEDIPRIAEEVTFIDGPEGDIPNIQIDGYRSASTVGVPVKGNMAITFHTMSLPTARLVWHCPTCVIFYSDDGSVHGKNYKEFGLMRLDGETWKSSDMSECSLLVDHHDFGGWDAWKKANKEGYDCEISFKRDGNVIIASTENLGISVKSTTEVKIDVDEIYVALTGDQVALTDIRIIDKTI